MTKHQAPSTREAPSANDQRKRDAALLKWCEEVTALLVYQPEVPQAHKEDLVSALNNLEMANRVCNE